MADPSSVKVFLSGSRGEVLILGNAAPPLLKLSPTFVRQ